MMKFVMYVKLYQAMLTNSGLRQQNDRKESGDKCDRAITCVFRHALQLTFLCSGLLQKDLFKGR